MPFVNVMQGTNSSGSFSTGNTLPLFARPFGMTDWTLQSGEGSWGWFFNPQGRQLQGIRATHMPSPWMGDYGYFTVMAQTGKTYLKAGQRTSTYRPEECTFSPNYLRVPLRRYSTLLEMTPTERCSLFRFTFPRGETGRVLLQMEGASQVKVDMANRVITGFTRTKAGGAPDNFACYFAARFDAPWQSAKTALGEKLDDVATQLDGDKASAVVEFASAWPVVMQIGTSFISPEQALQNLQNEVGTKTFDDVKDAGQAIWNADLNRISIKGATPTQRKTFYSCLYRSQLFPRQFHETDATGKIVHYSPYDGKVHDGVSYTDNGFWDTFRTVYPLFALTDPGLYGEMVDGFLAGYREGGWMAQWPSPGFRSSMPGTHGDAIIADAVVKGIGGFDVKEAYAAITKHADNPSSQGGAGRNHIQDYLRLGYVPGSVAESLDYPYDDWCISQVAQSLGLTADAAKYRQRALNYQKNYDPSVGFMRGKNADGSWMTPFNQYEWGGPYVEGGPWQSSWAVQHDPNGLMTLMGGQKAFAAKLDQIFSSPPRYDIGAYGTEIHEMTEMAVTPFNQYDQGNQPMHHVIYLFSAAGQPWKTQYWSRRVMNELYSPEGFAGDDDNGEMSSWYILNALGLYSLCPGRTQYVLGSPLFTEARIHLDSGKDLVISAPKNSPENMYVQGVTMNGKTNAPLWIDYATLMRGGTLSFQMGPKPLVRDYLKTPALLPASLSPLKP